MNSHSGRPLGRQPISHLNTYHLQGVHFLITFFYYIQRNGLIVESLEDTEKLKEDKNHSSCQL